MYHGIGEPSKAGEGSLSIQENDFEAQMEYLSKGGYISVLMKDLVKAVNSGKKLPKKSFVLTFDDAPRSILLSAARILSYHDFKAVLFPVVSAIGKYNFWDDNKPVAKFECMSLEEIQYLAESGWEIGSHTMTHAELQTLRPEMVKQEVEGSKKKLEEMLNTGIESFCYPYGGLNGAVRQAVIDAGYTSACAISPATASVTEDLFRLKRVYIKPQDSLFTFKRKIAPWYLSLRGFRKR
jgi:peptidoglycan/xylan/chitin deacetylase (PgdA/CDA1 family)